MKYMPRDCAECQIRRKMGGGKECPLTGKNIQSQLKDKKLDEDCPVLETV